MFNYMVFGHKEHGKDTFCEILRDKYGLSFASSSETANDVFMFDALKGEFGYKTKDECFADRRRDEDMRERWYLDICDFVKDDLPRLGRIILKDNNGYCGCRDKKEFYAMKEENLFTLSIFVDGSARKPLESEKSMKLSAVDADIIANNNGALNDLETEVDRIYKNYILPMIKSQISAFQQ